MAEYDRSKKVYAKGTISEADLESRKAAMQTTRADLENAELLLSRCTVTAPIEGVIRSLNAKVGLLLSVADPIAEILQIHRLKAIIGIPESDVTAVSHLDTVELCIQALDNTKITAKKYFLPASPETNARVYNLELQVDNSEGTLFPGMFVRADIVKQTVKNAMSVPFYSVISRNGEQFVFVEHDGLAEKRPVHLGIMEKWMVEVTDGLHADDRLIVEGHRSVEDNQKVHVVRNISDPGDLPQ
jgi:membrane fusion protein (multidrug efflux system)